MNTAENLVQEVVIMSIAPTANGNAQCYTNKGLKAFIPKDALLALGDPKAFKFPMFGFMVTETFDECEPIDANTKVDANNRPIRELKKDADGNTIKIQRSTIRSIMKNAEEFVETADADFNITLLKATSRQTKMTSKGLTTESLAELAKASF